MIKQDIGEIGAGMRPDVVPAWRAGWLETSRGLV